MSNALVKPKVFVAMSGGVDSSVAALLLKQQGYDVVGVFMKNWTKGCEWKEDKRDAMRVCAKLGIPFLTFDFTKEYHSEVLDYMLKEYLAGRTPNPDVMCNKKIKFGVFLKKAREMGADYIATGHYTRLRREFPISNFQFPNKSKILNPKSKTNSKLQTTKYKLLIARDASKDQSYFLWTLTQKQLKYCLFPIGDYLKSEVREIARKAGLATADKKDSQGLCFVGKVKFKDFLADLLSVKKSAKLKRSLENGRIFKNKNKYRDRDKNFKEKEKNRYVFKKGLIKTTGGKIIGEHKGLEFYTIGQRHGIGISGCAPYFVAEKDIKNNALIIARKNDPALYKKEIFVKNLNWIVGLTEVALPLTDGSRTSVSCKARIRYRQPLQDCEVYVISENRSKVLFKKPAWAVAPGQSIVFYKNQQMLGGGIIEWIL